MEIKTGFNLFVRQALLYPLTLPFLPAPADVKKDVSYANGSKIGTLETSTVHGVVVSGCTQFPEYNGFLAYVGTIYERPYFTNALGTVNLWFDSTQNYWCITSILGQMGTNDMYTNTSGIGGGYNQYTEPYDSLSVSSI